MSESREHSMGGDVEWVGGRLSSPFFITDEDGESFRPDFVIWMNAKQTEVMDVQVVYPDEPVNVIVESLQRALQQVASRSMSNHPVRIKTPTALRVADKALAEVIQRAVPALPVHVAETPELMAMLLRWQAQQETGEDDSYMSDKRIAPALIGWLFKASARLYRLAPWKLENDELTFKFSVPALDIEDAYAAVIGGAGGSRGVLIFPDQDAYVQFATAAMDASDDDADDDDENADEDEDYEEYDDDDDGDDDDSDVYEATDPESALDSLESPLLSLCFEKGAHIPKALRREIDKNRWEVAGSSAYPVLTRNNPDAVGASALVAEDCVLGALCAEALVSLVQAHVAKGSTMLPDDASVTMHVRVPSGVVWPKDDGAKPTDVFEVTMSAINSDALLEESASGSHEAAEEAVRAISTMGIQWVEDYVDDQAEAGRDDDWCDVAEFACSHLINWKVDELDGLLDRWTPAQVQLFLLDYFPETVGGDKAAFENVPEMLSGFFTWLADHGHVESKTVQGIKQRIKECRAQFLRATLGAQEMGSLVQLRKPPQK